MLFAATWMDLEMIMLSEVSQTKTNITLYHLYVESKKNDTNELVYKTEIDSQTQKTNLRLPNGKGVGDKSGTWGKHTNTTIYNIDKQQGPTVQHRELYSIFWEYLYQKRI